MFYIQHENHRRTPGMTLTYQLEESDRIRVHINRGAVAHNLAQLRLRLGNRAPRIWAVAKADAYGHGLLRVLPGLRDADGISVQTLSDAHHCREAGWSGPILVHAGLLDASETRGLTLKGLHLTVSHAEQLAWLADAAPIAPPIVWLRYAGETRFGGFDDASYRQAYARATTLVEQGRAAGIGHLNHYGQADEEDSMAKADASFRKTTSGLPGMVSTCNSAALLRKVNHSPTTDWARPGVMLYGVSPLPGIAGSHLGLKPAMTLTARLISTQHLPAGSTLGYGGQFRAPHDMRIGVVACGYADGYPRQANTGTPLLVGHKRTRLLGRPSMDTLIVDLSDIGETPSGTAIVLWGDGLPVEYVAASAGTIAADLLTGLTMRVPVRIAF
jgi:alanine racemase